MSAQRHVIRRQRIELTLPGATQSSATAYQSEVSRIFRWRITPLIEQIFTQLTQPNHVYRFDSLVLELGTLTPAQLEEQLLATVNNCLRRALAAQIEHQAADTISAAKVASTKGENTIGPNTKAGSALALVSLFIRTGNLPWWADQQQGNLLNVYLQELLALNPQGLICLLQDLLGDLTAYTRLVNHYDDQALAQMCGLLIPVYRQAFVQDSPILIAALQRVTIGQGISQSRQRQLFWCTSLQVAVQGGGEYTSSAAFYVAVFSRIAPELGLYRQSLQVEIQQMLRAEGDCKASHLSIRHCRRLAVELSLLTAFRQAENLPLVQYAQEPFTSSFTSPSGASNVIEHQPYSAASQAWNSAGQTGTKLTRLLRSYQSRGGILAEFWGILGLNSSQLSLQANANWWRIVSSIATPEAAIPSASEQQQAVRAMLQLLQAPAVEHGLASEHCHRLLTILRSNMVQAAKQRDLTAEANTGLVVSNAGLVILWPFLGNFFIHLGLQQEREFADLAARQRAVGLLQVLATGQVELPEYLLPLNKLLCGLDLGHPFDIRVPLTAAEIEQGEDLLQSIIAQTQALNNISSNGFRGSFLLRAGLLKRYDEYWLLRVESQPYDLILQQLPWSWGWVKLPWMELPLRVEWVH